MSTTTVPPIPPPQQQQGPESPTPESHTPPAMLSPVMVPQQPVWGNAVDGYGRHFMYNMVTGEMIPTGSQGSQTGSPPMQPYYLSQVGMGMPQTPMPMMNPMMGSAPDVMMNARQQLPQREGVADCQFYLQHGRCAYGASCKFNHPPEVMQNLPPVAYNSLGLPLRPGQVQCSYYLRTKSCKYGSTCKFDHPELQPRSMGSPNIYPMSPGLMSMADMSQALPGMMQYGGTHPMMPPNVGYGVKTIGSVAAAKPNNNNHIHNNNSNNSSSRKDCNMFMRTGQCQYGTSCRYSHSKTRQRSKSEVEPPKSEGDSEANATETGGQLTAADTPTGNGPVELPAQDKPLQPATKVLGKHKQEPKRRQEDEQDEPLPEAQVAKTDNPKPVVV